MSKKIDMAGMWHIKANPITKEGVFMYSGRSLDASGIHGLDPDELYPVYRSKEELIKACESFNGKPIINDHTMLGTEHGITKPDDVIVGGSIYNVRPSDKNDGIIVADMTIYSEELQTAISAGKKELSLGYFCKYDRKEGSFNGTPYQFVQYDLEGNHIALVDRGRMGSDVRVFDNKETSKVLTFDSMEINKMNPEDKKGTDADKTREEVKGLLKGVSDEQFSKLTDEQIKTIGDIICPLCGKEVNHNEPCNGDEDPEKKGEDKPEQTPEDKPENKDANEPPVGKEDEKKPDEEPTSSDEKKEEEKVEIEKKEEKTETDKCGSMDAAELTKKMMREFANREALYKSVTPYTGEFDHDAMTEKDVAKYACDKLKIETVDGAEVVCVKAYIKSRAVTYDKEVLATGDSALGDVDGHSEAFNKLFG